MFVIYNGTIGVMFVVLASSAVDRGFEPLSGQTKDYKSGVCCLYGVGAKKNWLAKNQDNVSEWSDMATCD